jgi:hypothetical protein
MDSGFRMARETWSNVCDAKALIAHDRQGRFTSLVENGEAN